LASLICSRQVKAGNCWQLQLLLRSVTAGCCGWQQELARSAALEDSSPWHISLEHPGPTWALPELCVQVTAARGAIDASAQDASSNQAK